MDKLLGEYTRTQLTRKLLRTRGGQELPDDATAEQIAKQPAASLRTTDPELRNLNFAILVDQSRR
jgi:hypothetical protein